MSAQKCERCGSESTSLMDYCAACLEFRCNACMSDGCCGDKPAHSGWRAHEYGDPAVEIEALHKSRERSWRSLLPWKAS